MDHSNFESNLFSVIVLHYKQPNFWKEAIQSVLDQDYPNVELIFSDDCSPDFDMGQVRTYIEENRDLNIRNVIVRSNIENCGTALNCDLAFGESHGEYLLFLDGDDVLANHTVLTQYKNAFDSLKEDHYVVGANCLLADSNLQHSRAAYTEEKIAEYNKMTAFEQYKTVWTDFFPIPSATAFHRTVFDRCGTFSAPHVRLAQDAYYYPHCLRLGIKFNMEHFIGAIHREGGVCNPIDTTPSASVYEVRREFIRIAEFELFPYFDQFSSEERARFCRRYYENNISYRMQSNDLEFGLSQPAYSILKDWADQNEIPWWFSNSNFMFYRDSDAISAEVFHKFQFKYDILFRKHLHSEAISSNQAIAFEKRLAFLSATNDKIVSELEEMEVDKNKLSNELKSLKVKDSALRLQINYLKSNFDSEKEKNETLQQIIDKITEEKKMLELSITSFEKQITNLNNEKYEALSVLNAIVTSKSYRLIQILKKLIGR